MIAKRHGRNILIGSECGAKGHRLRTRSGHCIHCNPSALGFHNRHRKAGYVYVAGSKKLKFFKIGFATAPNDREKQLNYQRYGGAEDWTMIFWCKVREQGVVEQRVLKSLSTYSVETYYLKDRVKKQKSREVVECSLGTIVDAIYQETGPTNHHNIDNFRDYEW